MQELIEQLKGYARGVWRQRWYALLVAWALSLVGWLAVIQMPDQYEATTKINVDTTSILQPMLKDLTYDVDARQQVELVQRTLLSFPNLQKVARATDLDLKATNDAEMQQIVENLRKDIKFERAGRENYYSIRFVHEDKVLAGKVVQSLLDIFMEETLGDKRRDADQATKFIEQQIEDYRSRLEASEAALSRFKVENVGKLPEQGRDYYERLQEANRLVTEAELELRQNENQVAELQKQLVGEEPTYGMVSTPQTNQSSLTPELDARISALESNLDEYLLRYTDKHPDVVNTRALIEQLQAQKQQKLQSFGNQGASNSAGVGLEGNPVYQQIKISLREAEAKAAALRVRVAEYKERQKQLQDLVNVLPEVEKQLKALNRDYEITKANYDKLVARRESARIQNERQQTSSEISFDLVEPPRVSAEPVGPNRPLFLTLVLFASLGIGVLVSFVISQILSTFDNPRQLMSATDIPVLGTVSLVLSPGALRVQRIKNAVFGALFVAIVPVYLVLVTWQSGTGDII